MPQKQNIDSGTPVKMTFNIDKVNKTTAKLIRCLSIPKGGRYLLNAQFKKIVLHECTKEVYPKTRDAALGPRCQRSKGMMMGMCMKRMHMVLDALTSHPERNALNEKKCAIRLYYVLLHFARIWRTGHSMV